MWVNRYNYWIAPQPTLPGVWRRREGGCFVRGRVVDPRTGKQREVQRSLPDAKPQEAFSWLQEELAKIRRGAEESSPQRLRFSDFAVSCLERRLATRKIKSAKNRIVWGSVLKTHLIPEFGSTFMDSLRSEDFRAWQIKTAAKINAGKMAPTTGNNHLRILRTIMNDAVHAFRMDRNPLDGVEPFDTSEHEVYTDEEPNALTVDELKPFLKAMRDLFPQHFAMVALGFATGLRPSSLRPLRKGGETPDIRWGEGVLLVRRSQTVGDEVMNTTKTGRKQRLALPEDLIEILRWHVDALPEGPMTESELLFPNEAGGFRSPAVLQKPFARVSRAMGLRKHISPRAMRRTFQDLARAAEVKDIVTRSISGHSTEEMQHHYSTVGAKEQRDGLAQIVTLAGVREVHTAGARRPPAGEERTAGGGHGGGHGPEKEEGRVAFGG